MAALHGSGFFSHGSGCRLVVRIDHDPEPACNLRVLVLVAEGDAQLQQLLSTTREGGASGKRVLGPGQRMLGQPGQAAPQGLKKSYAKERRAA